MDLRNKYSRLISHAQAADVQNLAVNEQDNVLYITGSATESVKKELWDIYNQIDPDMRSGDLVLNIDVKEGGEETYEVQAGDNLSKIAQKYDGLTWQQIYEANKDTIKDPNIIQPGQKLRIPL